MKKVTVILAAMLLMLFSSTATYAADVSFGPKAGVILANLFGDDVEDSDWKTGMAVGGFVTIPLGGMFSVQPEVLYIMKGSSGSDTVGTEVVDSDLKMHYIEIPVLLKLNIPTAGSIHPHIFAGPAVALQVKAELEQGDVTVDAEDVKDSDFLLVAGAGIDLDIGPGKLCFDARFSMGLLSAFEDLEAAGETIEQDAKNMAFMVMVGFGF